MATKIPILTYHRVHLDHDITLPDDRGRVNLSQFQRQMDYLVASGVHVVTHQNIAAWICDGETLPDRSVALDFDDNRLNVLENAFPVMREHGFRGTVFTVTYLADGKPPPHMKGYPAMGWPDLIQLRDAGWCVAPHTMRHLTLAGPNRKIKDLEEVREEMAGSLERIREVTCMDTPYFAYPEGCWDEEVEAIAKTLFKTARHWQTEETDPFPVATRETDPFRLVGINVAFDMTMERFRQIIDTAC